MSEDKVLILIADDDMDTRTILVDYLSHRGYEVAAARDGNEALELAKAWPPDLALLDVMMPGRSGVGLASLLKELYPDIQVIIITAYGSIGLAVEAMQKGAFCYLTKPIRLQQLLKTIQDVMNADEESSAEDAANEST